MTEGTLPARSGNRQRREGDLRMDPEPEITRREPPSPARAATRWVILLLALASLLSNPQAVSPDRSYYFRDFTVTFYPIRLHAARELAAGRWAFWNPYFNEGAFALPVLYPPDLVHALRPTPEFVSWLLTLHFPLAALAMFALARDLGIGRLGAFLAGAAFSLGGLAASSLNLYVFLQALAWAPLVTLTVRRASLEGGRWVVWAAVTLAISLSTLAVEFVAQALVLGWALGWPVGADRRGWGRMALGTALGGGLAAVPIALVAGLLPETVRGAGFDRSVALGNELHPFTLLQVLLPNLFGSLARPVEQWWGGAFFSKGFPYFLSIYLGPVVLILVTVGARALSPRVRWSLFGLCALAIWYSLGVRGGLAPLAARLPGLSAFRFPSKALLLPYLIFVLLAGRGLDRLSRGRGWRSFGLLAGSLLAFPIGVCGLLWTAPRLVRSFLAIPAENLSSIRAFLFGECLVCIGLLLLALLVARTVGHGQDPMRASVLVAGLAVADLARAGSGMNPQVDPAFFQLLPELRAERLDLLGGGRVFTYGVDHSPAFLEYLRRPGPGTGLWSFFVNRQMLSPYNNVIDKVEIPEAKDLTSFVLRPPEMSPEDYEPRRVAEILPRLRNAAVVRVLSLDPLEHPELTEQARVPTGVPGLAIHVYALSPTLPRDYVACRVWRAPTREAALAQALRSDFQGGLDVALESPGRATCTVGHVVRMDGPGEVHFRVELDGEGYFVSRDSFAKGWNATVDGLPQPVLRANGKHRSVRLAAGAHEVVLTYRPPRLREGLYLQGLSTLLCVVMVVRPMRKANRAPHPPLGFDSDT